MHASFEATRGGADRGTRTDRDSRTSARHDAHRTFPRRRVPVLVLVALAAILLACGATVAYPFYAGHRPTPTTTPPPFGTDALRHRTDTFTDVTGKERTLDVAYLKGYFQRISEGVVLGPVSDVATTYVYRISGGSATRLHQTTKDLAFTDSEGKEESLLVTLVTDGDRTIGAYDEATTRVSATSDLERYLVSGEDGFPYLLDVGSWTASLLLADRDGHSAAEILARVRDYRTANPSGTYLGLAGWLQLPVSVDTAGGARWIYWTNWRIAFEDSPKNRAGEFRAYDPATKTDVLLCAATGAPFVCGVDADGRIVYMPEVGSALDLVALDPATGSAHALATISRDFMDFTTFGIVGNRLQVVPQDKKGIWEVDLSSGEQGWIAGTEGRLVTNVAPDADSDASLFSIQVDDATPTVYRLALHRKGEALRFFDPPAGKVAYAGWLDADTALVLVQAPNGKNAETWIVPLSEFK